MFSISNNIMQAIQGTEITIESVPVESAISILSAIEKKYVDSSRKSRCLWDRFADYAYVNDSDSWKKIKDFINDKSCIMFFNEDDDKRMYKILNGEDLNYILSETFGFEFYITNEITSFVICFNDHDILYGVGDAKQWIETIS